MVSGDKGVVGKASVGTAGTNSTIRLGWPDISFDEVSDELRVSINGGWLTNGRKTIELEECCVRVTGTRHAVVTSSGTTALHLALLALGIGPGDEVIVPSFTFPATANVVLHCGATPVLADVDAATYNLDPQSAADHITPKTKAILPVHQFGLPADITAIQNLAKQHGLAVVEDAACAIGATYQERPCGSLGDIGCFSFHPRKIITTGEGGAMTTNREKLAAFCRLWRNHGITTKAGERVFEAPAFNYRLDEASAILGLAQIRRLADITAKRRELAHSLTSGLKDIPWLQTPSEPPDRSHVFQSYVVVIDRRVSRHRVVAALEETGIEASSGGPAIHIQPYFKRMFPEREHALPISTMLHEQTLALPLHNRLTSTEISRIIEAMRSLRV